MAVVVISVACSADHSNIISDSSITSAKNASVFFDHCRTSSSLADNSFGRPKKAFHVNETRSILLTLSRRDIVYGSYCIVKSRLISNLSFQRENLLVKLSDNLLHCHRHSRIIEIVDFLFNSRQGSSFVSPHHDTAIRQTMCFLSAKLTKPAVHHHNNKRRATSTKLCAPERHDTKQSTSTNVTLP